MGDILYVALGQDVKENKSILLWAIQNSGGKNICVIHVHQPAKMIPMMGTKFPASSMKEQEVRAYWEIERQNMQKIMDAYLLFCGKMAVQAESRHIEMDSIEKGIVELIAQLGIKNLVMGGAADKHYSRRMMNLKSKKAIYVRLQALVSCHIQFTCKGCLIHTREGILDGAGLEVRPSQNSKTGPSNHVRSQSVGQHIGVATTSSGQVSSLDGTDEFSTPRRSVAEGSSDEWVESSRRYPPGLDNSTSSSSRAVDIARISSVRSEGSENGLDLSTLPQSKESLHCISPPSALVLVCAKFSYVRDVYLCSAAFACLSKIRFWFYKIMLLFYNNNDQALVPKFLDSVMDPHHTSQDGSIDDTLYAQLEKAMAEAENARREAFQEADRRGKAEKNAIEAMRRAQLSESLCAEEFKQRKEIEEALANEKEEHEKVKIKLNKVMEDLRFALDQKSSLESQIAESHEMINSLELRIVSAVEMLQTYKKERDEFLVERDNALKEAEELRRNQGEFSSTQMPQFSEFSFSEIEEATQNFDPSLKMGEGRHGNIYKGFLREIQVAIKVLQHHNFQDPSRFQSEVDTLNNLRHPNLVTLIGYCQEVQALIYEYVPYGSLEDRLSCKDNTPPLSWQIRVRIATELCSALIFLHSCKPRSILLGDLTPAKVLLEANFVSKLCDYGNCSLQSHYQSSNNNITQCWRTEPKGSNFAYLDPEFLSTGELTLKSDAYSFGITLLQLLTGRPPWGITKEVQYALDAGKLQDLLDPLAGDWPFVLAEELAHLALRCCEVYQKNRPDLGLDVWPVLEPMRALCGDSSLPQLSSKEHSEPPSYFLCPISQDIMQDPHVAADGFTYEAKFLREWFDSGHDTSPMTNLNLEHCNLVANHALRSAIQEWQQKH